MNEMTTAGDIGSVTTGGTAPMVRYGDKEVLKRKNPLKKQGKRKMKTFREIIKDSEKNTKVTESPVGKVGRTTDAEALAHIENSDLAKEFRKIVKKLGGKNVARQLLAGMNTAGNKVQVTEGETTVEQYIRSMGYKIKSEKAGIRKKEIIFYKAEDSEEAFEDLQAGGFEDNYNIDLDKNKKTISYTI